MPRYSFNLQYGDGFCADLEGTVLGNDTAAKAYAREVVCELMSHRERKTRHWKLEVCGEDGACFFAIPFATMDRTLDHLDPNKRHLVERLSESCRALAETVFNCRMTVLRSRAIRARMERRPYLAVQDGRRI